MPRVCYVPKEFCAKHQAIIDQAEAIIREYARQGFDLTLRQLYYQFVARDLLPNTLRSYKNLGNVISAARLAGEIDWLAITDRTRFLRGNNHWNTPAELVEEQAERFNIDHWEDQAARAEVWIEKDALVGVIAGACESLDVDYFSCRGYVSQSEMWRAAARLGRYIVDGQAVHIFHLGDHDPSGLDMTRDICDRLALFLGPHAGQIDVQRIALNRDQVDEYEPPPNPAKVTDSRAGAYIDQHGRESWELDALEPAVLVALIETHVGRLRDMGLWTARAAAQEEGRQQLRDVAEEMTGA